ncbi:transglutaminase family protein [Roseiflexus castenholzii]|jgi:transglutaminase-like putative cysteine protease|uniref:Transglutaminase domain protein n=1 Tax=Roseiflexus castenholzii (strain DSM 13941 / HLO8) TaxID=383372 RepID=A7NQF2_ROSCS|nr:transglutaminase family protein [Roseiflexus castenholzii]ABU59798.1 transglutaminase domain protein [Roseiflexus castenholzii DSM 13941]
MLYHIRHLTRFRYSAPVSESVVEVRMQPRSDGHQRLHSFQMTTIPRTTIFSYRDILGNMVHHFDVPGRHKLLTVTSEALVEVSEPSPITALDGESWRALDALAASGEYWDLLQPGRFTHPSDLLRAFAAEIALQRGSDPLTTLCRLNTRIYDAFEYAPGSTHVHSPIDDALRMRRGVCQDFAHIMITLTRALGIPCRYVSGYLFHRAEDHDRSEADATHAWVEALLPGMGWVGFDPTNNLIAGARHIRVAIGRDYADVPPSRGVYKGQATSELDVAVRVALVATPSAAADEPPPEWQAMERAFMEEAHMQQ